MKTCFVCGEEKPAVEFAPSAQLWPERPNFCHSYVLLGNAFDRIRILLAAIEYPNALRTCDWHMPLAHAPCIMRERRIRMMHARRITHLRRFTHLESESHVSHRARGAGDADA